MTTDLDRKARDLRPKPCGWCRVTDGRYEVRIGGDCPPDRSGGYSTPWVALYDTPAVDAAVKAALRLAVPEWQPIETAPRDGTIVMIHERWEDVPIFASWHKGKWYADTSNYDGDAGVYDKICQHNVTHWQPLPAAPTLADEGES